MIPNDILPMQIPVAIPEILDATVTIRQWKEGDPFPDLGKEVAVDTETELITDSVLFPDLVVTGVFDPEHLTSWLIDHKSSIPFMRELCRRNIKQYYFNLGFDEGVLSKNDPEVRPLVEAIDSNRVIDMQIRMQLYQIATIGFKLSGTASLAGACRHYLKFHLDKGDGTENSARLSFHRDVTLTEEQVRYLPFDCIATWALSAKIPAQATEEDATKGMCVMAHTSANGFLVDRAVHAKYMKMLNDDKAVYARQLMDFGFPVRDFKEDMSTDALLQKLTEALDRLTHSQLSAKLPASKKLMRRMLVYMYNHDGEPSEAQTLRTTLNLLRGNEPADLSKQEQALYDEMVETFCLEAIDKSRKQAVIPILLTKVANNLAEQPDPDVNGYDVTAAITDAVAEIQSDEYLLTNKKRKGPKEFFQGYVTDLLLSNCDKPREQVLKELEEWKASIPPAKFTKTMYAKELIRRSRLKLDTSPLSGDLKLTKYDLWKLEDLGISDKFLTAYTKYNHCDKYISTYLNEEFIKSDGRVHPKFENLVRTGRTSCSNPNMQNLPSKDPKYKLKLVYRADPGYILCATDFSFIELCAFAQSCYSLFRNEPELKDVEGSVMRLVINAGLDPHRWFAGVMYGKIDADLSRRDDPEWVAWLTDKLNCLVDKKMRQNAKMANFGLPGGLSEQSYYNHCREQGMHCTYAEAKHARDSWMATFREMSLHMTRLDRMPTPEPVAVQYGFGQYAKTVAPEIIDEEDEGSADYSTEYDNGKGNYLGITLTGMRRAKCTANSAANIRFQGLVSQGAKLAGWELVRAGYADRFRNFIHDEFLLQFRPQELDEHIPIVERLMLKGMKKVIPDVKVGVETACSIHWDKGATEYLKLPRDANGLCVVSDEVVEELLR